MPDILWEILSSDSTLVLITVTGFSLVVMFKMVLDTLIAYQNMLENRAKRKALKSTRRNGQLPPSPVRYHFEFSSTEEEESVKSPSPHPTSSSLNGFYYKFSSWTSTASEHLPLILILVAIFIVVQAAGDGTGTVGGAVWTTLALILVTVGLITILFGPALFPGICLDPTARRRRRNSLATGDVYVGDNFRVLGG